MPSSSKIHSIKYVVQKGLSKKNKHSKSADSSNIHYSSERNLESKKVLPIVNKGPGVVISSSFSSSVVPRTSSKLSPPKVRKVHSKGLTAKKEKQTPQQVTRISDKNTTKMSSLNINTNGNNTKEVKSKFLNLKIDTSATYGTNHANTPATSSTSNSSDQFNYTPSNVRGRGDVRSPGEKASPLNATASSSAVSGASVSPNNPPTAAPTNGAGSAVVSTQPKVDAIPIPDFITQTDQYGNPTTPRSDPQISSSNNTSLAAPDMNAHNHEDEQHDPCDAILESFRMMCCCLLSDEKSSSITSPTNSNNYHNNNKNTFHTKSHTGIGRNRLMKNARRYRQRSSAPNNQNQTSMLLPMDPNDPNRIKLLPKIHPQDQGKKCLVLDLDETLVHSSFRAVPGADFVIPVQIEDVVHFVYVAKRPGVDNFLLEMAKYYEIVIYTASLNKYADPLLDLLDPHRVIRTRLFRESCVYFEGNYVKDMSLIDRDLSQSIIVDNSPNSYLFHPENAIDCSSFIDDPMDRELIQIGGFLKNMKDAEDVRGICHLWKQWPDVDLSSIKQLEDIKPEETR